MIHVLIMVAAGFRAVQIIRWLLGARSQLTVSLPRLALHVLAGLKLHQHVSYSL